MRACTLACATNSCAAACMALACTHACPGVHTCGSDRLVASDARIDSSTQAHASRSAPAHSWPLVPHAYLRAGSWHSRPLSRRRRNACSPACWCGTPLRTPAAPCWIPFLPSFPFFLSSLSSSPRPFTSPAPSAHRCPEIVSARSRPRTACLVVLYTSRLNIRFPR